MGFFDDISDTFKVVKDIVGGGIDAYKAGEKLNELIDKISDDYGDDLSSDEERLLKKFRKSARAYEKNDDSDKNNELLEKMEDDQIAFLEAVKNNSALPKDLRNEIETMLTEFKRADNFALESTAEVLEKHAETDEDKAKVRKLFEESKRK